MIHFPTLGALQKASSGSTMATKAGVGTTVKGGASGSSVTAGGSTSAGTAGNVKPEVDRLWMPKQKWKGAFGC